MPELQNKLNNHAIVICIIKSEDRSLFRNLRIHTLPTQIKKSLFNIYN